jgi:hypothetical protein
MHERALNSGMELRNTINDLIKSSQDENSTSYLMKQHQKKTDELSEKVGQVLAHIDQVTFENGLLEKELSAIEEEINQLQRGKI